MSHLKYYLTLVRPLNLLIIIFTMYVVRFAFILTVFKENGLTLQVSEFSFAIFSLAFVLLAAGGYVINDCFDIKIDTVNKQDKVIVGKYIPVKSALTFYWILNIIGFLFGCVSSFQMNLPWISFIFLIYFSGLWLYSYLLKRTFLIGNLLIALFVAFVPLAAAMVELLPLLKSIPNEDVDTRMVAFYIFGSYILVVFLFAFVISLAREIIKDIEDMEGDLSANCSTIPILLNKMYAKRIVQFLLLIVFIAIGFLEFYFILIRYLYFIIYIICFIQIPIILIVIKLNKSNTSHDFHRVSNWLKVIMALGICNLFFYWAFKIVVKL